MKLFFSLFSNIAFNKDNNTNKLKSYRKCSCIYICIGGHVFEPVWIHRDSKVFMEKEIFIQTHIYLYHYRYHFSHDSVFVLCLLFAVWRSIFHFSYRALFLCHFSLFHHTFLIHFHCFTVQTRLHFTNQYLQLSNNCPLNTLSAMGDQCALQKSRKVEERCLQFSMCNEVCVTVYAVWCKQ